MSDRLIPVEDYVFELAPCCQLPQPGQPTPPPHNWFDHGCVASNISLFFEEFARVLLPGGRPRMSPEESQAFERRLAYYFTHCVAGDCGRELVTDLEKNTHYCEGHQPTLAAIVQMSRWQRWE